MADRWDEEARQINEDLHDEESSGGFDYNTAYIAAALRSAYEQGRAEERSYCEDLADPKRWFGHPGAAWEAADIIRNAILSRKDAGKGK